MASAPKLVCLPPPEVKTNTLFFDLGKPTKRGTKKCPDCGCINGTKSYSCKNTFCNRILKHTDRHKIQIDAIKLHTGRNRQIYSVRACDKTHDIVKQRGFVQLPCTIFERDKLNEVALCFVSHCERSYSILKCHENEPQETPSSSFNFCAHIAAAVKSLTIGHPLEFKHDLINNLKACESIRKKLCALANASSEGPLVQCIARNVWAIKCFVNSAYPLGYLHFSLEVKKTSAGEEIECFHCECSFDGKCLHYYVCICAFASDAKYLRQYHSFLQQEFDSSLNLELPPLLESKEPSYSMENIKIEILCTDLLDLPNSKHHNNTQTTENVKMPSPIVPIPPSVKGHVENRQSSEQNIKILSNNLLQTSCFGTKLHQPEPALCDNNVNLSTILTYTEWLSSVIERINYSSTSMPSIFFNELEDFCAPNILNMQEVKLEFHIPEKFFKIFRQHLYTQLSNFTQENSLAVNGDFGVISTTHFAVNEMGKLEKLFTHDGVKLATYQLVVNTEWPFRIAWTGNLYKASHFGELQFIFIKQSGNNC